MRDKIKMEISELLKIVKLRVMNELSRIRGRN